MTDATIAGTDALNVRTFGAKGDDKTDDTAAIQAAIDAAGEVQGHEQRVSQAARMRPRWP